MTSPSRVIRLAILIAMVTDLAAFSGISLLKLTAICLGTAMVLLGLVYSYRHPAVVGLLVLSATAAGSIELTTLLEADKLLTAIIGLLMPISALAWIALTVQEERQAGEAVAKAPAALATAYAFASLLSAPTVIAIMGLLNPGVSMRVATMGEAAIVLTTATVIGIVVVLKSSSYAAVSSPAEQTR